MFWPRHFPRPSFVGPEQESGWKMNLKAIQRLFSGILTATVLSACGNFVQNKDSSGGPLPLATAPSKPGTDATTGAPTVNTYQAVRSRILQSKCTGCHSARQSPNLASYDGFARDTRYVIPGNPEQSALYASVASGAMPQVGTALQPDELSLLANWIREGAQNN